MPDPITLFTIATITDGLWYITKEVSKTLAGEVGGGRVDSLVADNWKKLRENLKLYSPDANHDLHKAISRSYLQATLQVCALRLEKIGENTDAWFRRELLPKYLSKPLKFLQREKFAGLGLSSEKDLLKAVSLDLLEEIKALEESKETIVREDDSQRLALLLNEYELLLRPESGIEREAAMRQQLTDQVIVELNQKYGNFTPAFEQLLTERWFELLCACFQYYLKHKQEVANIFTSKLLADMRVTNQQEQLTFADVGDRLEALGGKMVKQLEQAQAWLPEEMRTGFDNIESLLQSSMMPLLAMTRSNETRLEMLLLLVRAESQRVIDEVQNQSQRVIDELSDTARHDNQILLEKLAQLGAQLNEALKAAASLQDAVPRQLASPPLDFVGREEELQDLLDKVKKGGVMISGLQGMGGIGKTALALKLADALKADYPDGQIFLDLKGVIAKDHSGIAQQPFTPSEVMEHVVNAYFPTAKMPDSLDQQLALYRSVLADKRALLLFDNARDAAQIHQLLPTPSCLLIVTSRQHFSLPGMYDRNLEKLKPEEACKLLLKIESRIGGYADTLAALCDYLPIALRAVASALANRKSLDPKGLAQRLQNKKNLLKLVDQSRNLSVEAAFSLSYELLGEVRNGKLQERWRMLAIFPDAFDAGAAAAVWQVEDTDDAKETLEEIERYSLLEWNDETKRYSLHDLARDFAATLLSDEEQAATQRLHAIHYRQVLSSCDDLYLQGNEAIVEGLRLYDLELRNIQVGHDWAVSQWKQSEEAARLCSRYPVDGAHTLSLRQPLREFIRWLETALSAAQYLKDRFSEGEHLNSLGLAYSNSGEVKKAIKYYDQALGIARQIGNPLLEGAARGNLGTAYKDLGEVEKAIRYYKQALVISRQIGDRRGEGTDLCNLGMAYLNLGKVKEAIDYNKQARAISLKTGDPRLESAVLCNLGRVSSALGEVKEAIGYYEQALVISRQIGDRHGEGIARSNLGNAYSDLGEVKRAIEYYKKALVILCEIGDHRGEGSHLGNLGVAYRKLGEVKKAIEFMEASLKIFEEIESPQTDAVRQWLEELRGT